MKRFDEDILNDRVQESVGHPPPFSAEELADIKSLFIAHLASIDELSCMPNLKVLFMEKSVVSSFDFMSSLDKLTTLSVTVCSAQDIGGGSWRREFAKCVLKANRIENLRPLLEAEGFWYLDLRGNPLDEHSYRQVIPKLREKCSELVCDNELIWQINVRLLERALGAAYCVSGDEYRLYPLTAKLQFDVSSDNASVYAVISPDELKAELDKPDVDLADLVERYQPRQGSIFDKRERGMADQAREWVEGADLDKQPKESLNSFVDRFEEATFVGEPDEILKHYERQRGPARHDPGWSNFQLPDWVRRWRNTVAYAEADGAPSCFVVEQVSALDLDEPLAFTLRPMGRRKRDFAQVLINRHGAYPIGYAGDGGQVALVIDTREGAGDEIFAIRTDEVYRWAFDPYEHLAFANLAELFDAVEELATGDEHEGCPAKALGDFPPEVSFELEKHLERGDAPRARAWLEEASLPERLTEALGEFVADYGGLTYVREDAAALEYYEVINNAQLPRWYHRVREVLAFAESDESAVALVFGGWPDMAHEVFRWGTGNIYYDMGRRLIREYAHYPVMTSPHYFLSIRLDSERDRKVYWSDVDEVDRGVFHPSVQFDSLAQMFDAVTGVRVSGGEVIERG